MKLTDKDCKAIVAEYAEGGATHRSLAVKYGVAPNTIKKVIDSNGDFAQRCAEIKNANTKSMLEYLQGRLPIAQKIVKKALDKLYLDIESASAYQVTGIFKTVVEIFLNAAANSSCMDSGVTLNVHFKDLSVGEKGAGDS